MNTPNKVAIQSEQGTITYRMFEDKINQTANAFINLGVEKGETGPHTNRQPS